MIQLPLGITPEFLLFVAIIAGTPGPLNLTLMGIGLSGRARFGAGAVLGAAVAYGGLYAAASAAARQIATMDARLFEALQVVAAGFLVYLAWKMVRSRPLPAGQSDGPRGLARGATLGLGVVLLGSKSSASAISASAIFCDGRPSPAQHAVAFGATATVPVLICCTPWLLAGLWMSRGVRSARVLRAINIGGAACLAGMAGFLVM